MQYLQEAPLEQDPLRSYCRQISFFGVLGGIRSSRTCSNLRERSV